MNQSEAVREILDYHDASKHRLDGYARGPGTIDWDDQPSLFRRYADAAVVPLPLDGNINELQFDQLYHPEQCPRQPLNRAQLGLMLRHALGLSAWKVWGRSKWSLRCNPSSGNLHPGEAFVLALGIDDLDDGLYHYDCLQHALVSLAQADAGPALRQRYPESPLCLLLLTSIPWREAWKYGERAFRYCQLDLGHSIGSLQFAAASRGWRLAHTPGQDRRWMDRLLGLQAVRRARPNEAEYPETVLQLITGADTPLLQQQDLELLHAAEPPLPEGLGARHHYDWPVIDNMYDLAPPPAPLGDYHHPPLPAPVAPSAAARAGDVVLQRRSAQQFDPDGGMDVDTLLRMLDMTLPRPQCTPWQDWPWPGQIDLLLFVHSVRGLDAGLYLMQRSTGQGPSLHDCLRAELTGTAVDTGRDHLRLFRLIGAGARRTMNRLSCRQDIAGDSCFALAMIAPFREGIAKDPGAYRRLYREAGLIGQILYLEAEQAGLRGTGIGCYFDDAVHELLGLTDNSFQDLYHFTVGVPLVDSRLASLSGYHHLKR